MNTMITKSDPETFNKPVQKPTELVDEYEDDETNDDDDNEKPPAPPPRHYESRTRRTSVFSKSYDPESVSFSSTSSTTTANNTSNRDSDLHKIEENDGSSGNEEEEEKDECEEVEVEEEKAQNRLFQVAQRGKEKTREQVETLRRLLKPILLFKHLYEDDLDLIIGHMFERECVDQEVVIREAASGNYFYVILSGTYSVYIKPKNSANATAAATTTTSTTTQFGNKVWFVVSKMFFY